MAALFSFVYLLHDPRSSVDMNKYLDKYEKSDEDLLKTDLPLGYSKAMRKRREENPELYEA